MAIFISREGSSPLALISGVFEYSQCAEAGALNVVIDHPSASLECPIFCAVG